jgi:ABC-type bacteriocin/lantibiotic exporter with double-glycine peptidase domain
MPPVPGGARNHGKVNFKALNKKTVLRLLKYLFKYKFSFSAVLVCIAVSAVTTVLGTTFLQTIIDGVRVSSRLRISSD